MFQPTVPNAMRRIPKRAAESTVAQDENDVGKPRIAGTKLKAPAVKEVALKTVTGVVETKKRVALAEKDNIHQTKIPRTRLGSVADNALRPKVEKSLAAAAQNVAKARPGVHATAAGHARRPTAHAVKAESGAVASKQALKPVSTNVQVTEKHVEAKHVVRAKPSVPAKVEPVAPMLDTKDQLDSEVDVVHDLDEPDAGDPLMVSEYVVEIYEYLKTLEGQTLPNPEYMDTQKELEWKMRSILHDWLIEVHNKFHLLPETLFLAVNIVDRFLSRRVVSVIKLQLVGIVALFIASKYQEIMAPSVHNFIYMADNGYTEEEVLKAERYVLGVLEFDLSFPNPLDFLRRISKADDYDLATRTIAKYLLEIPLVDHRFLGYPWSQLAAASMWFARKMEKRGPWTADLVHYSGYTEEELLPIVRLLHQYIVKPVAQESLFKKFAHKKFLKASIYCRDWALQNPTPEDVHPHLKRY